jgi:hypothetical protein
MRGCLGVFGWCLLGSLLGAIGLASLGWGVGTIDVLYGHRPAGEFQSMPEFGRGMMTIYGGLLGSVAGAVITFFCVARRGGGPYDKGPG